MNYDVLLARYRHWSQTFAEAKAFWANIRRVQWELECFDIKNSARNQLVYPLLRGEFVRTDTLCRVIHKIGWDVRYYDFKPNPKGSAPVVFRSALHCYRDGFIGVRWDVLKEAIDIYKKQWNVGWPHFAQHLEIHERTIAKLYGKAKRWDMKDPSLTPHPDTFFRLCYMLADDPMVFFQDNRLNRYPSMSALEYRVWPP